VQKPSFGAPLKDDLISRSNNQLRWSGFPRAEPLSNQGSRAGGEAFRETTGNSAIMLYSFRRTCVHLLVANHTGKPFPGVRVPFPVMTPSKARKTPDLFSFRT